MPLLNLSQERTHGEDTTDKPRLLLVFSPLESFGGVDTFVEYPKTSRIERTERGGTTDKLTSATYEVSPLEASLRW